jgi:hypothetical protein
MNEQMIVKIALANRPSGVFGRRTWVKRVIGTTRAQAPVVACYDLEKAMV